MYLELLLRFNRSIEGLRDFVDLIRPMLTEYHKKESAKHNDGIEPLLLAHNIATEDDETKKKELSKRLTEIYDGEIEIVSEALEEDSEDEDDTRVVFKVTGDTTHINAALAFQSKSLEQLELLYVNSLISLLSTAEWFYSQLLHHFYDQNPNAAGIKKKTLTLEELQSFGTVQDAENYLIDSKIESLLRSGFTDWIETLKSELKLGLGYTTNYIEQLIEIYQRRNLFVHNGGVVNSIYLSKVNSTEPEPELGTKLTVKEDYLNSSIDTIHIIFSLIACELWKKNMPKDNDRSAFLMDLSYDYLLKGKWDLALIPNTFLKNDAKQPTIPKTYAQLNCWLCSKRINGSYAVIDELNIQDFSDKTVVIQIALASLKDDVETFFSLIDRAVDSEEMEIKDLFEFPILEEMRITDNFRDYIKTNERAKKFLESEDGLKYKSKYETDEGIADS